MPSFFMRLYRVDGLSPSAAAAPFGPLGRVQEAILFGDLLQPPVVQLLARVHHELAIVRVQMLHLELQGLEVLIAFGWKTADVAKPVVDEHSALDEVHLVEGKAR